VSASELQVLLLTELVSTAYYRVLAPLAGHSVAEMCELILRDVGGARRLPLRPAGGSRAVVVRPGRGLWQTQSGCSDMRPQRCSG